MTEGRRPGGLTALAVLNFVFGGLNVISTLGLLALMGASSKARDAITQELQKEFDPTFLWVMILIGLVVSALMIVSGVGYLGMKRFLGRTMGNAFSILSLAQTAVGVAVMGFNIGTVIGLIYPVLTLALLNTTFKDDLVN